MAGAVLKKIPPRKATFVWVRLCELVAEKISSESVPSQPTEKVRRAVLVAVFVAKCGGAAAFVVRFWAAPKGTLKKTSAALRSSGLL